MRLSKRNHRGGRRSAPSSRAPPAARGRPPGHEGAGRTSFSEDEADVVEDLAPDESVCPHCHCELLDIGVRDRSYIEIEPIKPKKKLVHIHRRICPGCMKTFERKDILEKGVKDEKERALLEELVECLKFAMTLRRREPGKAYDHESRRIRNRILEIARTKVKDGAVAGYFDIFRKKRHRLFQWVAHPEVLAENNLAERRLRPLVIARKLSFGSQSTDGLRIRETLLTVMDTLRHIVETLCRARFRIVETERQPRSDPAIN